MTDETGKRERNGIKTVDLNQHIWEAGLCCSLQAMAKTNNMILTVLQALSKWLKALWSNFHTYIGLVG